ncbi:hypothetical protein AVEN_43127-1 [Araneus ventricosus]|uniref:Uncharacterized protein n=1 Tax=Araneus ventricosus TaxID=182803 RepID=A0A4Y2W9Q4_ARAVE|nr:hypothetical protein AVEN_43127-1 [Araneus ventricosus]
MVRCRHQEGSRLSSKIPPKIRRVSGFVARSANPHAWSNVTPAGVVRKFGDGVPAQVSSSSSDRGSRYSPRVATKRDVNGTKLKLKIFYLNFILREFPPFTNAIRMWKYTRKLKADYSHFLY